jgi:plastocyanin
MDKMRHEKNSINQNKQLSFFSILIIISISFVFLISDISFTFENQNALAQNSVNVFSSSGNGQTPNTASVNINSDPLATTTTTAPNNLPDAKSVSDTGEMVLPPSVSGFIITLPDETHHPDEDNLIINPSNAHYLPANLVIPSGTAIAFAHGDPNHVHSEVITDVNTNNVVWTTTSIKHPGATDDKVLPPGSYTISDSKYEPMKGTITVEPHVKSTGSNLVVGAIFAPTPSLENYKSQFQSAGFQIASTFDFTSAVTKQKDLAGPTTLIVYSTSQPLDDAKSKLLPILKSLPYR